MLLEAAKAEHEAMVAAYVTHDKLNEVITDGVRTKVHSRASVSLSMNLPDGITAAFNKPHNAYGMSPWWVMRVGASPHAPCQRER